jgi:hypothetical protein
LSELGVLGEESALSMELFISDCLSFRTAAEKREMKTYP